MGVQSFDVVMSRLRSFKPPEGWDGDLFLLPQQHMCEIHDAILRYQLASCLELGTGFGATACVMAAALERNGRGRLTTVDRVLHQPVNADVLARHVGCNDDLIEIVVDDLGYNWWLADLLAQQTNKQTGHVHGVFDFCFIDGAHEWETDALAFLLASRLLKPGGWMVLDDLDFRLRQLDQRPEYRDRSPRELDTYQVKMIYDLLLAGNDDFEQVRVTPDQRMVWARKRRSTGSLSGLADRVRLATRKLRQV